MNKKIKLFLKLLVAYLVLVFIWAYLITGVFSIGSVLLIYKDYWHLLFRYGPYNEYNVHSFLITLIAGFPFTALHLSLIYFLFKWIYREFKHDKK